MTEIMNPLNNITLGSKLSEDEPFAYNTLIYVFRYLELGDLISCTQVCKIWRWIALDESLWKHVNVRCCTKHIQDVVVNYGPKISNLVLLNPKILPLEYFNYIFSKMTNLRSITLCGCHKDQLKVLSENHKDLERICAEINWGNPSLDLDFIGIFLNLTHLKLVTHIELTEVQNLKKLTKLKHLVFHAPCDEACWKYIAEVESLESLSLDTNIGSTWVIGLFDSNFYIKGLRNLRQLQINDLPYFHEYNILEKVKELPNIKELILLNISISPGGTSNFGRLLGECHNIEKLTISIFRVAFYSSVLDVALENTEILNGVSALKNNLKYFCWIMDASGMSSVQDFYNLDDATALKMDRNEQNFKTESKAPFIEGVAPVTMPKLLKIIRKRLPNTEVSLLLNPQTQRESIGNVKDHCYMCTERIMTAQDRMKSYT